MNISAALEIIGQGIDTGKLTPFEVAELLDRQRILKALERTGWNQCYAAEALGLHRNTLNRRMTELGIVRPISVAKVRRAGRPATEASEIGRGLGIHARSVVDNGLDRDIAPLVMKIRLKRIKIAASKARTVDRLLELSDRLDSLKRAAARA